MKTEAHFYFFSSLWNCCRLTQLSRLTCCFSLYLFYRKSVRRWEVQRERSSMRTSLRWKRQGRTLPIVLHSDLVQNDRLTQWWPVREVCTYTNKCVTVQNWWPWLNELNTEPQIKYESLGLARFNIQDLLLSLCEHNCILRSLSAFTQKEKELKYSTHKWNIHAIEI